MGPALVNLRVLRIICRVCEAFSSPTAGNSDAGRCGVGTRTCVSDKLVCAAAPGHIRRAAAPQGEWSQAEVVGSVFSAVVSAEPAGAWLTAEPHPESRKDGGRAVETG